MQEVKLYAFGENGITYTLFNNLNSDRKIRRFLSNTLWMHQQGENKLPEELKNEKILCIYLFPSFGKRYGPGEPDVMIITKKYNVFIEVETCKTNEVKDHLCEQIRRFVIIGNALHKSKRRRLGRTAVFNFGAGYRIRGTYYRHRKLFQDVLGKEPMFIVVTNDNSTEKDKLRAVGKSIQTNIKYFGIINYRIIKNMMGMQQTTKSINFNISKQDIK